MVEKIWTMMNNMNSQKFEKVKQLVSTE